MHMCDDDNTNIKCYLPIEFKKKVNNRILYYCFDHYKPHCDKLSLEEIKDLNKKRIDDSFYECKSDINRYCETISKKIDETKIRIIDLLKQRKKKIKYRASFIPIKVKLEIFERIILLIEKDLFIDENDIKETFIEKTENKFKVTPHFFDHFVSEECKKTYEEFSFEFPINVLKKFKMIDEYPKDQVKYFIGMDQNEENDKKGNKYGIEIYEDESLFQGKINSNDPTKSYKGIRIYKNGDMHDGKFIGGKRNGEGLSLLYDKTKIEGSWHDDKLIGKATLISGEGRKLIYYYIDGNKVSKSEYDEYLKMQENQQTREVIHARPRTISPNKKPGNQISRKRIAEKFPWNNF